MSQRTVVCYGDSNTHGTLPMPVLEDKRRLGPAERWPGVMAEALGSGWRVIEEGLPGRTTVHPDPIEGLYKNGIETLPAILGSHDPIDLVIIMLGTNDTKPKFSVGALDIALSVEKLALLVRSTPCGPDGAPPRVLMIAPPPVIEAGCLAEIFAGAAAKSAEFARTFAMCATRAGADLLDAGAVISSSPVDGVHFDAPEHAALGRAIAAKVKDMFAGD